MSLSPEMQNKSHANDVVTLFARDAPSDSRAVNKALDNHVI